MNKWDVSKQRETRDLRGHIFTETCIQYNILDQAVFNERTEFQVDRAQDDCVYIDDARCSNADSVTQMSPFECEDENRELCGMVQMWKLWNW